MPEKRQPMHSSGAIDLDPLRKPLQSVFDIDYPKIPKMNDLKSCDSFDSIHSDEIDEKHIYKKAPKSEKDKSTVRQDRWNPRPIIQSKKITPERTINKKHSNEKM